MCNKKLQKECRYDKKLQQVCNRKLQLTQLHRTILTESIQLEPLASAVCSGKWIRDYSIGILQNEQVFLLLSLTSELACSWRWWSASPSLAAASSASVWSRGRICRISWPGQAGSWCSPTPFSESQTHHLLGFNLQANTELLEGIFRLWCQRIGRQADRHVLGWHF